MKILLRKRKVVKIPLYELRGPKFLLFGMWDIGTVQGDLVSNFFRDHDHLLVCRELKKDKINLKLNPDLHNYPQSLQGELHTDTSVTGQCSLDVYNVAL